MSRVVRAYCDKCKRETPIEAVNTEYVINKIFVDLCLKHATEFEKWLGVKKC